MPAIDQARPEIAGICSNDVMAANHIAKKFKLGFVTSSDDDFYEQCNFNTLIIANRHDKHASSILRAVKSKKHVFCEKPLCLLRSDHDELFELMMDANGAPNAPILMMGYNRRFSPFVKRCVDILAPSGSPSAIVMNINAGAIDKAHWTQDINVGGGRLLGEACHFIDLAKFLINSKIKNQNLSLMKGDMPDTFSITLSFEDGSIASINYFANGNKVHPKEKIEIYNDGTILTIDNFRKLTVSKDGKRRRVFRGGMNKGHMECMNSFINSVKNGEPAPITLEDVFEVSDVCLKLLDQ
jgi:predicted dehydrogenase